MNCFIVYLRDEKNQIVDSYKGRDASLALAKYQECFRELLTRRGMKTIQTAINGKVIDKYFDLLLQDQYGA